jgi:hypothetical protein
MSTVFSATNMLMYSRTIDALHDAFLQFVHALVKCDTCLNIHGTVDGVFLIGDNFSFAECMTAPFIVRMLANLPKHRNIDPLEQCCALGLTRMERWIIGVRDRFSVRETSPTVPSMYAIPPYAIKAHVVMQVDIDTQSALLSKCKLDVRQRGESAKQETSWAKLLDEGKEENKRRLQKKNSKL